jgi:long-chain acyl-CoA synthetase
MKAIEMYKVNYWVSSVPMNVAIMNHPNVHKYDLSSLRLNMAMSFGITLTEEIAKQWSELTKGGYCFESSYGLTETHTYDCFIPINKIKYGVCGIPNAETDIRIFDFEDRTRELPIGEEGEIAVKTPSHFLGYWNKPEATKETLINGWVYTGDVGKFDEDGYLAFLGRRKEMIKVSGFSVFPEEVELLLCKHPAVAQAAVIPKAHEHKGEIIKAFIILKPGASATAEEIQAWAKENMSSYKVPAIIEFVDSLPMSGVGKVLRRLLD